MEHRLLVMMAESPVHAGGSGAEGSLDLPIQRETATGLPVIWGQSLKGALRDAARDQPWEIEVFGARPPGSGPDSDPAADPEETLATPHDHGGDLAAGAVAFGDLQLVAFPAATMQSGFAWATSRQVLNRLQRKTMLLDSDLESLLAAILGAPGVLGGAGWVGKQVIGPYVGAVHAHDGVAGIGRFLGATACPGSSVFDYTRAKLATDLLVLPDDDLIDLTRLGTELLARIQLKIDSKTVEHGPFYSEHLPAETILAGLLSAEQDAPLRHVQNFFDGASFQLGGDETIGKGLLWCRVLDAAALTTATEAASVVNADA